MTKINYYEKKEQEILRALSFGLKRNDIYAKFGYSSLRAMNTFMRRRGYIVTEDNYQKKEEPQAPVPPSVFLKQFPKKAQEVALYFENHAELDPISLAKTLGFHDHTEMNQYMKLCGLRYHSRTGKYYPASEFRTSYTGVPQSTVDKKTVSNLRSKRCTFFLSEYTFQQLENYANDKQLSKSEALELVIREFFQNS